MKHTNGFTLIELMITVVIIGILAAISIPNMSNMRARAREAGVRENCNTVRLAAEDFAVRNLGTYAQDLSDTTPDGVTIVDMLPNGTLLANPFTGANTEPIDGPAAQAGEVGYEPVLDGSGVPAGYKITGFGHAVQVAQMIAGL